MVRYFKGENEGLHSTVFRRYPKTGGLRRLLLPCDHDMLNELVDMVVFQAGDPQQAVQLTPVAFPTCFDVVASVPCQPAVTPSAYVHDVELDAAGFPTCFSGTLGKQIRQKGGAAVK